MENQQCGRSDCLLFTRGPAEPRNPVHGDQPLTAMKTTFTYTILRYVHDIATGEFVNMGLALYAPEAKYVSAIRNPRYGRLSKLFLDVNGEHLRSVMRYIQARFEEYSTKLNGELPLDGRPRSVMEIAMSILPKDDSSLQWSEPNGGCCGGPGATIEEP